jgi:hypothetical protein
LKGGAWGSALIKWCEGADTPGDEFSVREADTGDLLASSSEGRNRGIVGVDGLLDDEKSDSCSLALRLQDGLQYLALGRGKPLTKR